MRLIPTQRLYYDDAYLCDFEAEIVEISPDGKCAYLDRTAFYPTSGGQPYDRGTLADIPILEVIDEGERIAHILGAPVAIGPAAGRVNWRRRYDHMQQHTGQHLLSAVILEQFGIPTLSFHMGEDTSTIEIGTAKLDDSQIERIEERASELVGHARPVTVSYEDSDQVAELRKASARTGTLRIITVDGVDRSACGGTHVRSSAEIGPLHIRSLDRVRGNIRLEFVCGRRGLRVSKRDFRLLEELARQASTPPAALPEHMAALRARLDQTSKEGQSLILQLARHDAERLYVNSTASGDGLRRVLLEVPALTDLARATAIALAAMSKVVFTVFVDSSPPAALLACSKDSGLNAGALWKAAFAAGGGRGGGSPTLAQGSLTDRNAFAALTAAAGFPTGNALEYSV